MESLEPKQKKDFVSPIIFSISFVVILIHLVALVFPSLIPTLVRPLIIDEKPFELGTWAIPLLVTNVFFLVFGILYYRKKIPKFIINSINFILNFEVSRNISTIVVVALVFGYAGVALQDLSIDESKFYGDFKRIERVVDKWPFEEEKISVGLYNRHVTNFLLKSSQEVFQNMRVVPFLASISLLILVYFFTLEFTKKRFAGIVAMIVLIQSYTFQIFDTLATYSNFWTLFYLLSLYLIYKKWYLSPLTYILSIFSKPLTVAFFPMTLFFTYRAEISKRKKIQITISYVVVAILMVVAVYFADVFLGGGSVVGDFKFDTKEFWSAFTVWSYQLRFDGLFLLFILPLTVALYLRSRKGIIQGEAVIFLIVGTTLAMPFLAAMTGFNLHPYRYIPLIVFFAIGVGTLLAQRNHSSGLKTV